MLRAYDLQAEHMTNPIGISINPRLSWKIEADGRGSNQKGFYIEIAKDPEFENIVFAETSDDENNLYHVFEGFEPQSLSRYYWHVAITDARGVRSELSETASFVTALMEGYEWDAKFITVETDDDADNSKGTILRKEFCLKKKIKHAYLMATAHGLYQVYIDGNKVGEDELTPGWTSYHNQLLYQTYDVTEQLSSGEKHCVGAMLGAGFYKGLIGFHMLRNHYGNRTAFLMELYVEYEDGSYELINTDESWKGTDSAVIFSEIYDGEIYDARKEIAGWCECGLDTTEFTDVSVIEENFDILKAQAGCKPRQKEALKVKEILVTPQGDKVIDFGQNHAGWIHIIIDNANPGDVIELDCFESLDACGNVYTENLRKAKNRLVYTCKGGHEEYNPHFTYQGYRYAKVVSWAGDELTYDRVCAYAVYSDMKQTGSFSCSNPDINQLWSNITWSLKSNFVDIPTDCPQRNERVGWTGDAQIFCRTACYIMDTFTFFEKWLRDVAFDQTVEGGVPHVVPDIVTPAEGKVKDWLCSQGSHSAAAWADVAVLNPWHMYLTYGDKQILIDQYESMKKWIQFMESHADGIIWNYRLQFGDWVALDAEEGSYFGATPNDLTCTAYYAYSTGIFAKIAGLLGHTDDAGYFGALYEKIKKGFSEKFFDPSTGGMNVMTQTAHIVALYFGLTPDEYKEGTTNELIKLLEKENGHLVTGFVGTPYFTHALSQNGHLKEAYELLMKDDFPSWLYQVKKGATTIWEHWDGLKPDGTMWSADMNSFNHYAYGSIGEWLIRVVAGIEWDEEAPGYKVSHLYPRIGGGLTSACGEFDSVYGVIRSSWRLEDDKVSLDIKIPANTSSTIRLDDVSEIVEADGVSGTITDGVFNAGLKSGEYHIVLKRA